MRIRIQEIKKWKKIPFETIFLESTMDNNGIVHNLKARTEITNDTSSKFDFSFKDFKGQIKQNEFVVMRLQKNIKFIGFIPIAKGQVVEYSDKTIIKIRIKFNGLELILHTIFLYFIFLPIQYITFLSNMMQLLGLLFPLIIVYLITIVKFNCESKWLKQNLMNTIKAEIKDE